MTATLSAFEMRLREYYDRERIAVEGFFCPHREACQSAAPRVNLSLGAEAYVGPLYGSMRQVAVVLPDAEGQSADLEGQRRLLEEAESALPPQIQGILRLLRKVLAKDLEGASPSPYFALIHAAKCSGRDRGRDALPQALRDCCRPYALDELALLEPDLVITLGEDARLAVERGFPSLGMDVSQLLTPANAIAKVPVFDGLTLDWLEAVALRYLGSARIAGKTAVVLHAPADWEADRRKMFEQLHLPICSWLIQEMLARRS